MALDPGSVVADLSGALARWVDAERRDPALSQRLESTEIVAVEVIDRAVPALVSCVVAMRYGARVERHHAVVAVGPMAPRQVDLTDVIGVLGAPDGDVVVWDALADPDAATRVMGSIAPGLGARRARRSIRSLGHSTLTIDDSWETTFFHRLADAVHPEVAMSRALGATGFSGLPELVAVWSAGPGDLAVVRRGSSQAKAAGDVARASVARMIASGTPPERSIGDLAEDLRALGSLTASFHRASAEARPAAPLDGGELADQLIARLPTDALDAAGRDRLTASYRRLQSVGELGSAISPHGRLTLDSFTGGVGGWRVADAGRVDRIDEPSRTSPLLDVATLLADVTSVARAAASELSDDERVDGGDVLVTAWEERLAEAFVTGYSAVEGAAALLPPDPPASDALLAVFELDSLVRRSFGSPGTIESRRISPAALDRLLGERAAPRVGAVRV